MPYSKTSLIPDMLITEEKRLKNIDDGGNQQPKASTLRWGLCVQWADETSSWLHLADLRETNPVKEAEYAISRHLDKETAFRWWVQKTLRKRDRWVCKVKTRYLKRTHKYGVELPKSLKEAIAIDSRTETTFWRDAIAKELKNVIPAFTFCDDNKVPNGYKKTDCHLVYDVNIDLTCKARLVASGHQTDVPKASV
jgi:hypothetical protein